MNYEALNLDEKFSRFSEHWSPRVVAEMNDTQFKLVKVQGEFVWHSHADTDEAFLVVSGALDIEFRDGTVRLESGEMFVVPRGVEHRPVAREDLVAPEITLNGEVYMEIGKGGLYGDMGAIARDEVDGDLSEEVRRNGYVNTSKVGEYEVRYRVWDRAGNGSEELVRKVKVVEEGEETGNGVFVAKMEQDSAANLRPHLWIEVDEHGITIWAERLGEGRWRLQVTEDLGGWDGANDMYLDPESNQIRIEQPVGTLYYRLIK